MLLTSCRPALVLLPSLAGALCPAPAAAQDVHVVDAGGGGDFTLLQDAVDAASAGDVILVRSTVVPPLEPTIIDGKALTVIGDGGLPTVGCIIVRNVPADATLTLRSIECFGSSGEVVVFEGLLLEDNPGTVFLEGLRAFGDSGTFPLPPATAALRAEDCASVLINGCTMIGGHGVAPLPTLASAGAPCLKAVNSSIAATRTSFGGGAGAGAGMMSGQPGGHGIDAAGSYVFLSGATVQGGANSGDSIIVGSDGLHVESGTVHVVESTFEAGPVIDSPPGEDIDAPPGAVQDLRDESRVLSVQAPLRSFEEGTLDYVGAPHDLLSVFVSPATGFLPLPSKSGVWQLSAPIAGPFALGMADAGGHLAVAFDTPEVAPLQGMTLYVQAVAQQAGSGKLRIGGASALVVVDDSF